MGVEVGLNLGHDRLSFGVNDLDRLLDQRRRPLKGEVDHSAADCDHPPFDLYRHRQPA